MKYLFLISKRKNLPMIEILLLQNAVQVIPVLDVPLNVLLRYLEKIARKFVCVHQWSSVILCMGASKVSLFLCVHVYAG